MANLKTIKEEKKKKNKKKDTSMKIDKKLIAKGLKKIGGGVAVGEDYKPGRDKALDAALRNILSGKVKNSSGINVKW
jgi:translation elongation factor EF-1beta